MFIQTLNSNTVVPSSTSGPGKNIVFTDRLLFFTPAAGMHIVKLKFWQAAILAKLNLENKKLVCFEKSVDLKKCILKLYR